MSDLLTANELAEKLRVQPSTVLAWAREERIPALRLSHKVLRFDLDDVVRALTSRREQREVQLATA